MSTDKHDELKKAADTLIKYLNENHHPHVTAIVTATSVELLEGLISIPKIYDHINDDLTKKQITKWKQQQ